MIKKRGYKGPVRTWTKESFQNSVFMDYKLGCWLWSGYHRKKRYGMTRHASKVVSAHRLSYLLFKGEIPEGLQIDHLCRVPNCVNPDHLEAVTCRVNIQRGTQAEANRKRLTSKKRCPYGHPYSGDNLYVNSRGGRECRECRRRHRRIWNNTAHGRKLRNDWKKEHRHLL